MEGAPALMRFDCAGLRAAAAWLLFVFALVVSTPAAQRARRAADDVKPNDASQCPYCHGDPALMAAAGTVSHGGFEFGNADTEAVEALMPGLDFFWIESEHHEIGYTLGHYKIAQSEKNKIRAELARLAEALPDVPAKPRTLDPWLRLHLYAQRMEEVYDVFLEVMQVEDSVFPSGDSPWVLGTPYFGEGPHLGQKGRYEILMLPTDDDQVTFLLEHFGLSIRTTQKWNVVDRDTLSTITNVRENGLRSDQAMHNHLAFNQIHNFVDGYKHYSYETPLWIKEGLAHYVERSLSPDFNSFSFAEGGIASEFNKSDWQDAVRKLIQGNDASRLAELMNRESFSDFTRADHLTCWSMTAFLLEDHADGYACLNARLHGLKGEDGYDDGSNMKDRHREDFLECIGMNYARFDQAWKEWCLAQ